MIVTNTTMAAIHAATTNQGNHDRRELFDGGTAMLGIVGGTVVAAFGGTVREVGVSALGVAIGP